MFQYCAQGHFDRINEHVRGITQLKRSACVHFLEKYSVLCHRRVKKLENIHIQNAGIREFLL